MINILSYCRPSRCKVAKLVSATQGAGVADAIVAGVEVGGTEGVIVGRRKERVSV